MDILSIILIAIGLAMDCFAVSVSKGLATSCVVRPGEQHCARFSPKALLMAVLFGVFQGGMPLIGYFAGTLFADFFSKFSPWIALGLLVFIGGGNVTGNINVTFFLAICTTIAVNFNGNKEYWKEIFWPDVPVFLKAYPAPLIPVIEFIGIFTKPFALMVRLFANIMAGHAVILSFTCIIFLGWSMGTAYGIGLNVFSGIMLLFMNLVEVLVAFVQAYVFTLLSAVFIGLSRTEHHAE